MRLTALMGLMAIGVAGRVMAQAPGDVTPIPRPGVEVPAADRTELESKIMELGQAIDGFKSGGKAAQMDLLPDIQIYYNAARYALTYNEFFGTGEIGVAKELLNQGLERARLLKEGSAPWTTQTGLVVRGYVSRIDGSVQPYGLIVPASYQANSPVQHRLDIWYHGRGETLSEVNFLNEHQHSYGEFAPANAFVLHPYGRYCNANRFAGEVDTFEALAHVKRHYPIDVNRIAVRGFSMGGAACWQFATHFAGDWVAAAPGAGFTETAEFLNLKSDPVKTPWYQEKLWHLYDSKDYAINLFNCPTVSYSGEIDGQRQAANVMDKALAQENIALNQIIGPKMGHGYERVAKIEVARRVDSIVEHGRNPVPDHVRFTTWTLRYNRMLWVTVDGLTRHWERARVNADIVDPGTVQAKTENVTALTFAMEPGYCPLDVTRRTHLTIDGQSLEAPAPASDRSWTVHLHKQGGRWEFTNQTDDGTLRKRSGLQGPIDDAFYDSFLMVAPTGTAMNAKVGDWVRAEREHAITHWRRQFRGEAPVKNDADVTDADIASHNLVLWGDPSSNKVLARIVDRLPVRWDAAGVHVGAKVYSGDHHVPVMIYPNPLNPKRYVVLNSGFTFREYDYLNNARQSPKLPDFAVVDVSVPATARTPGGIVDAGFFDEEWKLGPQAR